MPNKNTADAAMVVEGSRSNKDTEEEQQYQEATQKLG
jgi:hypothetical protein